MFGVKTSAGTLYRFYPQNYEVRALMYRKRQALPVPTHWPSTTLDMSARQPFQPREPIRDETQHKEHRNQSPLSPKHPQSYRSLQSNQTYDDTPDNCTNTLSKSRKSFEGIQRPINAVYSKPPPPRGSLIKQRQLSPRKSQSGRTQKSNLLLPRTSSIPMRLPSSNRPDSVHATASSRHSVLSSDGQSISCIQRSPCILAEEPEEETFQPSETLDDPQAHHSSTYKTQDPASLEPEHQPFSPPALPTISAMDSIFELDMNACIEMHMKEYNEEKLKWATCSMDDWVKGADGVSFFLSYVCIWISHLSSCSELASEFTSLLDFVSTLC